MNPNWLTVEYASTRLISFCTSAMDAAKIAVKAPMTATIRAVIGVSSKSQNDRQTT
jgi:hypothetical protein